MLAQYGYGRTDAADGRVWPWVFGAHSNYWSQIAMKMNFIAQKEGGIDKMKGKTIVHLHIDTAYGREPLPAMRQIAQGLGLQADRNRRTAPRVWSSSRNGCKSARRRPTG